MRVSLISVGIFCCALLGASSVVWANDAKEVRQKLFETDKAAAAKDFNTAQKQACIKAFNARYPSQYTLSDALAFDEPLSRIAYDRLFWKGEGNFQRGLIFTSAVTDASGAKAGNLLCYYATTDDHLDFQSAYVLPLKSREAQVAFNTESATPSALTTLSGKE